jgi:DNA-directed RNA polymerase subunit RPC12/RpoP
MKIKADPRHAKLDMDTNDLSNETEVAAMYGKCPGQDMRNLKAELYRCPNCGAEVEMFSDETRIKCKKCGKIVYKSESASCVNWCASARECLGEERWQRLTGQDEKKTD